MAVNSNSAGGRFRVATALATGWTLSAFVRIADITNGALFQTIFELDDEANNLFAQFIWDLSNTEIIWMARNGGDAFGDVSPVPDQNPYFMAMRWMGGAGNVLFSWRRLDASALTTVDSTRPGFSAVRAEIFRSEIFTAIAFSMDAVGVKLWSAGLTDEQLLRESYQFAPARNANLVSWYPLVTPATATVSNNGSTPLTLAGAVTAAASPNVTPSAASILSGM
jgi:hypothetical protein